MRYEIVAGSGRKPASKTKVVQTPEIKVFNTIRETSRLTGLSEKFLRNMHKENKLPGIYCGTRFMVNYPKLIKVMSEDGCE